jgi:hypothetical protein
MIFQNELFKNELFQKWIFAKQDFFLVLEEEPENYEALNSLGLIFANEKNYEKAYKKFSGSKYQKFFEPQDFSETYGACSLSPLNTEDIEIMTADFETFDALFSINLEKAEKLFKARKLTFNLTCSKGGKSKLVTNNSGECPSGFKKN